MSRKDMRAMARAIAHERQQDVPRAERKPWWDPSWKEEIAKVAWDRVASTLSSSPHGPHRLRTGGADASVGQKRTRPECVVCMQEEPIWAFSPCMHLCICSGCKDSANDKLQECPMCRTSKTGMVRIF